jgi:hypothetical protein
VGAAAATGAGIIGDQMKQQQAIEAEQRAADIKLDLAQRMAAADEMMKNRAAERFTSVVKQKAGEDVPVEAPSVAQTGVTPAAGQAAGYTDVDGTQVGSTLKDSPEELKRRLAAVTAAVNNPNLSDEQRIQAKELLAALQAQMGAQSDINAKSVDGKTRKRSFAEAGQAALEETAMSDPGAAFAGAGMLSAIGKVDATDRAAALKEKLAKDEGERKERIAQAHDDSREAIAQTRLEAMMERLGGGKNGAKSAMVQNLEWLKANLGFTDAQLTDFVTEKKHTSAEDIAAKLLAADKFGDLTPETAMEKATKLVQARDKLQASPAPAAAGAAPKPAPGKPANDPLGLFP